MKRRRDYETRSTFSRVDEIVKLNDQNESLFLLYSKYDAIVMDLQRILNKYHKIALESIQQNNGEFMPLKNKNINNFGSIENIKEKIFNSKLVVCIVNNEFVNSSDLIELVDYSKSFNIVVLTIIIENTMQNSALTKIKEASSEVYELYKERINSTGYDQWLWMSQCFNEIVFKIKSIVKPIDKQKISKLKVMGFEKYEKSDLHFLNSIYTQTDIKNMNCFLDIFYKSNLIDKHKFIPLKRYFEDLESFKNSFKLIDKICSNAQNKQQSFNFVKDNDFKFNDVCLEKLNFGNKNDYLDVWKILHELLLEAFKVNLNVLPAFDEIENIMQYMNNGIHRGRDINYLLNDIKCFKDIKRREKLVLSRKLFKTFHNSLINYKYVDNYLYYELALFIRLSMIKIKAFTLYEELNYAKIIVICLNKQYAQSKEFQIKLEKARLFNKKIIFVKLQSFDHVEIDLLKNEFIYELDKHIDDEYKGHVTKKLINEITSFLNKKPIVSYFFLLIIDLNI